MAAVGPGGDFGPHQPLGIVDQIRGAARKGVGAVAADQLAYGPGADVAGRQLGPQVSDGHLRHPHIGADQGEQGLVGLAPAVELEPGDAQTFLKNLRIVAGRTPRQTAAQIQVVGRAHGEGHAPALPEDGLDNEDVRDVHASFKRIVEDEDIALFHIVAVLGQQGLHGKGHRAQMQRNGDALGDHLALGIAQGSRVVQTVPHNGRIGRAVERHGHFVGRRSQGVAHDFARDRIYGCHRFTLFPL